MAKKSGYKEAVRLIGAWREGPLDLSDLGLADLPPEIRSLTSLTDLVLDGNQLANLPSGIGSLAALCSLDLEDNLLTSLPPEIGNLRALRELHLSGNQLTSLPPEIGSLAALEELILVENQLTSLPPEIGSLTSLTRLDLESNSLKSLPREIGNLAALKHLDLRDNQLTGLPFEIGRLLALQHLVLLGNQLGFVPPEMGNLRALRHLDLEGNLLTSVPSEIGGLTLLRVLDLQRNQITSLPPEIGNLGALQRLFIRQNPLPRQVLALADDLPQLLAYLREQASTHTVDLREVKLVFVGPPDAGKTCLLRKLQGKPFLKGNRTTYGFDIGREPLELGAGANAIRANCWDFGGQEKYEITHQFFFSKESVFVVVWEPREDTTALRRWLSTIQSRAGKEAPIFIIATYRDEPGHTDSLNHDEYRKNWPGIRDFFWITNLDSVPEDHPHPEEAARAIEATKGELERLREALREAAESQIIRDFPEQRRKAREKVRSKDDLAIFLQDYREACSEFLDETQSDSLLRQMDGLGDLVYHAESESDDSLIVLQPQWLGKAIGYTLDDKLAPPGNGIVRHEVLGQIWDQHAKAENYRPNHYPYFLWLMEQFDLAHRLDEKTDLIPKLIQQDRPRLPWMPDKDCSSDLQVSYQWVIEEDVPAGLVPILTAVLHGWRGEDAVKQPNWSQGLFLTTPSMQSAYVQLDDRILTVSARAQYPANFAEELRKAVEAKLTDVWPGLRYKLRVPCPICLAKDERPVFGFPLPFLEDQEKQGSGGVQCMSCLSQLRVRDLLTGYRLDRERREVLRQVKQNNEASREMAEMLNTLVFRSETYPNHILLAPADGKAKDIGYETYSLSLYCDHPDHKEPVKTYPLRVPKAWLKRVKTCAHWTGVIVKGVGLVVPGMHLVGSAVDFKLPDDLPKDLRDVGDKLFGSDLEIDDMAALPELRDGGAFRRVLEKILETVDPNREWGGLEKARVGTRVQWFCNEHKDRPPTMS